MKRQKAMIWLVAAALVFAVGATDAQAQRPEKPWQIEAHAGVAVPTFDISDLVKAGPVVGGGIGYFATDKLLVMAEADFGFHKGKEISGSEGSLPDVNVYHYMGKLGYLVYRSSDARLKILVNAGAGAMTFDPDVEGASANTYFAINAGAKLYYLFAKSVGLVVSPQGDIAFVSKDDGFTGSTAWVWPFTAGLYVNF